ncbi:sigma-70 family RNA polymerase sigma factor [Streptomyces sp. G-G2]|uniref:RNA polymerase sigma factor n=1 Tax=Streptomyces sp. G-G2 TaxID=3046201 RepID=UPI0024BB3D2A|nr:sigma-70 family RNA polymerase sigma factor [Streptomyces sp. G-G2]MDJ0383656.1 sigma-70 family RNA polymerase sigma factor [Streptomyces sp. G-G2]
MTRPPTAAEPASRTDPARLHTLVRAAQDGDVIAMQDLLAVLAPYVGRLAGPIALDDGPDAAQEALTVIFKNIGHLHEPAALFGWARAITVREAVRMARRGPRTAAAELTEVPAPGDPQLAADIRDVLDRLTPEHRAVLTLRDLEGLDEQAVGALLALPVGTVKSRLSRARRSFRKAWGR